MCFKSWHQRSKVKYWMLKSQYMKDLLTKKWNWKKCIKMKRIGKTWPLPKAKAKRWEHVRPFPFRYLTGESTQTPLRQKRREHTRPIFAFARSAAEPSNTNLDEDEDYVLPFWYFLNFLNFFKGTLSLIKVINKHELITVIWMI